MKLEALEQIETVVDDGRTHFVIHDCYAGSVNTYNNLLTKWIAYLAGKAMTITVNGEKIYANVNSLQKFMNKNGAFGFGSTDELTYRDLNTYRFSVLPLYGKERFMAAHISQYTKDLLSKELFQAITTNKTSLALKKIRQGAEVNTHAWFNENTGELFFTKHIATVLPEKPLSPHRFTEATPFLLALRLNQVAVARLIFDQMGDTTLVGQTLFFSRQLVDTKTHWNVVPTVRHEEVVEVKNDGTKETKTVQKVGADLHTSETKFFVDQYEDRLLMVYNKSTGHIDYIPQGATQTHWNSNHLTNIIPVW